MTSGVGRDWTGHDARSAPPAVETLTDDRLAEVVVIADGVRPGRRPRPPLHLTGGVTPHRRLPLTGAPHRASAPLTTAT